ncbi:hypothetical protein ACFL1N_05190 [Thermodesulfobacteriota bacterium]
MYINKNILIIVLVLAVVFIAANTYGDQKYGVVCIGPIPAPDTNTKACEVNPKWCAENHEFSIQIDDGIILPVPYGVNKKYERIKTGERHLLIIRDKGKIIESFWFSFENYNTEKLCLWFKPMYLTWSIWPQKNSKHLCKCD